MAEVPPPDGEYINDGVAEQDENRRYETQLIQDALNDPIDEVDENNERYFWRRVEDCESNFPLILNCYDDVEYIQELKDYYLKKDPEDFKRLLHAHLLSNGSNGGWLLEILKSAMKESMGFQDNKEVDLYVRENYCFQTFKDFLEKAFDIVKVEDGHYFPVLDDNTRGLYEDAVASARNKDDKERKKDDQIERLLEDPENVKGHYEGVNRLRKAIVKAYDSPTLKDSSLQKIPAMDGTDKKVVGINYNLVTTEYQKLYKTLGKEECKLICGRSTLMRGLAQGKPKCLVETIAMYEFKEGEIRGMYIALKDTSKEYTGEEIAAAVHEAELKHVAHKNRVEKRDQRDFKRQQQHQRQPAAQPQEDLREQLKLQKERQNAAAALSVPPSVPPTAASSLPPPIEPPLDPNTSNSSDRLDALARAAGVPSTSHRPSETKTTGGTANAMANYNAGDYGDESDGGGGGYSDDEDDDEESDKRRQQKEKRKAEEMKKQEQMPREETPSPPVQETAQQHPPSQSRSSTPAVQEDLVAQAKAEVKSGAPPAPSRQNAPVHRTFEKKKNEWEEEDESSSRRQSPVEEMQQVQHQPVAAAPPPQSQLMQPTSVFAPQPISDAAYQQPPLQQGQPMQQPGQTMYDRDQMLQMQPQQSVPVPPLHQQPPQTPFLPNPQGMQQVPGQPPQPFYTQEQPPMQPMQQHPSQGPHMGQTVPPSPAPSHINVVQGQPPMFHQGPQYGPGPVPPTPQMQQPPYGGGVPPQFSPNQPFPSQGGPPPQQFLPQGGPPPQQFLPQGGPPNQPFAPQGGPPNQQYSPQGGQYTYQQPMQQQPYYQSGPNQPPMQQNMYAAPPHGYATNGGAIAPVVNVHVNSNPSPSPSPSGVDIHQHNQNHPPASNYGQNYPPAPNYGQNYPPDSNYGPPQGQQWQQGQPHHQAQHHPQKTAYSGNHSSQGYGQQQYQGGPPPLPPPRESPPRDESPPFQQYRVPSPRGDSPPSYHADSQSYRQAPRRQERQSSQRDIPGFDYDRGRVVEYDEVGAAERERQRMNGLVRTPTDFGQMNQSERGSVRNERGFGRREERPMRVEDRDDRYMPGFRPQGSSTPIDRSHERGISWNRMEVIGSARRRIRWQIIMILKSIRDKNRLFLRYAQNSNSQNVSYILLDEESLFIMVQTGCGDEMELFNALPTRGKPFHDFLVEMSRDKLICMGKGWREDCPEGVTYWFDPHSTPPDHLGVQMWR